MLDIDHIKWMILHPSQVAWKQVEDVLDDRKVPWILRAQLHNSVLRWKVRSA